MTDAANIAIVDTTLREGEQCYGVMFPLATKKQIALVLNEIGVDFIEVGHPAAAPSIKQAVSEIAALDLNTRLIAHARLDLGEIRLVKDLGVHWVGLFCGINTRSQKKYGLPKEALFAKAANAVRYAKEVGLSVKFTCEDASRTEPGELIEFYARLASLGVDRMSYADTLGILTPHDIEHMHARVKDRIPFSMLHFHFHNDFGFAFENAVKALECGAQAVDASILGIGERIGLAPLEAVLGYVSGGNRHCKYQTTKVEAAVDLVKSCVNHDHYRFRRFAHKSGIHINGVIKDAANYEPIRPHGNGDRRIIVLSKLIGKSGLKLVLTRCGFEATDEEVEVLLEQVKAEDLLEIADTCDMSQYFSQRGLRKVNPQSQGTAPQPHRRAPALCS